MRRPTLLILTVAGIVPAFAVVQSLTAAARLHRQQLAMEWADSGSRALAAGRAGDAADDFRTAQQYAGDRGEYRLRLAQALVAAGRTGEAESQLQTL